MQQEVDVEGDPRDTLPDDDEDEFEGKLLHQSCLWDNADLLNDLLFGELRQYINCQDKKGRTALHAAVISNSLKCARLLLMNGADPNIKQSIDIDPSVSRKNSLHLAAERGQADMVKLLIEFNADIFSKDGNGFTAMDLAEQQQHQNVVDELKNGLTDLERRRDDLYKSLVMAVHKGDTELVGDLLSKSNSLYSANVEHDHTKVLDVHRISSLVNYTPNGSNTLLFKACQEGHLEIAKHLIESGADGRQHPVTKYSPLYISAYHGRLQICSLLLNHFPELSSVPTVEQWLPIHAASMNNHLEIVRLLLTHHYPSRVMKQYFTENVIMSPSDNTHSVFNSNNNSDNKNRKSSTHCRTDSKEGSNKYMYLMPFDLNAQDIAGQSILYLAALVGNQRLIEFLLAYRLKAIAYHDYVQNLGHTCHQQPAQLNETGKSSKVVLESVSTLFDLIYGCDESLLSPDSDSKDVISSSSDSSQDITVISPCEKIRKPTSQPQSQNASSEKGEHSEKRSIASSIQKLINKLSPTNSPIKQVGNSFCEHDASTYLQDTPPHRIHCSNSKFQIYLVNPINIDLYCSYNVETALHCAVKKKHYSIASLLLENGAHPNLPINGHLSDNCSPDIRTSTPHLNTNHFFPSLSNSSSLKDLKHLSSIPTSQDKQVDLGFRSPSSSSSYTSETASSVISQSPNFTAVEHIKGHVNSGYGFFSNALREAIRNRDKAMVDLLFRFGARDDLLPKEDQDLDIDRNDMDYGQSLENMSALGIAFANKDFHFVSKLLSQKVFPDSEFKINKKSFDIAGSNCMNAINKFNMVNNLTVSSMFPTNAVMVNWHQLKINSLDTSLSKHLSQWLIDASLMFNVKLKLSHVHDTSTWNTALAAITRIDLSNNALNSVPICLFTDLPSLKLLNLSKNCLQTLPEISDTNYNQADQASHDDTVTTFRSNFAKSPHNLQSVPLSSSPKGSKVLFSRMRKSQSVTSSLSSNTNKLINFKLRSVSFEDCRWNLPYLEELYLQDNQLECLPSSLFQQPELKILDLSNNKLRALPPLFWFAPKLSELNLSLNLLCELPSPIQCLSQMYQSFQSDSFETMPTSANINKSFPKSLSISSINENLSTSLSEINLELEKQASIKATLSSFDLNLSKPWSGCVNILHDSFSTDLSEKTKLSDKLKSQSIPRENELEKSNSHINDFLSKFNCSLTQLNLSHNGFCNVPYLLSCLATRLTHLNLSYNRLTAVLDKEYILGHFPLSLKHLDLSHNQIADWISVSDGDLSEKSELNLDNFKEESQQCFHIFINQSRLLNSQQYIAELKSCPCKQHTKLDNLKTLILTNNKLYSIIVTREELLELVSHLSASKTMYEMFKSNSSFHLSISFAEQKPNSLSNRLSQKLYNKFGSMDDLSLLDSNDMNINSKASRYAKLFFPNLSMLDIANNCVAQVPKTIFYLCQLSVLNLSGNLELTSLPPEMGLLSKLWNLNTRGCVNLNEPLRSMILSKTYKTCDIISYLNSILENSKPYSRLKLMIVGFQGIGKTSLLEQLRHEGTSRRQRAPDHWGKRMGSKTMGMKTHRGVILSTVGVDLCEWTYERRPLRGNRERSLSKTRMTAFQPATKSGKSSLLECDSIGPVTFRTWDFGGQQEYYATHQYFLSKRSIYLVVWKITDGEKGVSSLHSWLVNIQSRAPNSPVIIVGTHYDLVKEFYPPFFSSDLQNMIRERYMSDQVDADKRGLPKVVASIEVSAKSRYNIRLLANLIYETAYEMRSPGSKERLLEQKVPATYLALEEIVAYLANERKCAGLEPVMHSEQYRQEVIRILKERHGLAFRDYSELLQATRFLHENGVILHYEDANLKDLYFLDPQWLCDMLAHVVTIPEINPFAKNGIMKTENLLQLFKNTKTAPLDVQSYLLSLLNKFELALTWDNRTLLIPSLLPTEEQLRKGHTGCNILIPLRSKLKNRRTSVDSVLSSVKFDFKNQLNFRELTYMNKDINRNKKSEITESNQNASSPSHLCNVVAIRRQSQSIHRILLLTYVPCGFWSRLITRVLADESVIEIVRSFYNLPSFSHNDPALISFLNSAKTKWHCWQTGFGLQYFDTFLLRVKEISLAQFNIGQSLLENRSNQSASKSAHYPYDYQRIKFLLAQQKDSSFTSMETSISSSSRSQWSEIFIAPQGSALVEIYLPNQALQVDTYAMNSEESNQMNQTGRHNSYLLEPNIEMLTKLLVIIVEHIDTLLEDWYPSLGTRFIHTSDGRFLITRMVPCTLCMSQFVEETIDNSGQTGQSNSSTSQNPNAELILSPDTADVDTNLVDFYKSEVKKATLHASNEFLLQQEFNDSAISTMNSNDTSIAKKPSLEDDNEDFEMLPNLNSECENQMQIMSLYHYIYCFMVEECILAVYEDKRLDCPVHGRLRMEKIAPDVVFCDLKESFCIKRDQLRFGKLLGRGSFGFVFRAYYTHKKINPDNGVKSVGNKQSHNVSNSTFYVPNQDQNSYLDCSEVALKLLQPVPVEMLSNGIRKVDLEAYSAMKSKWERDPLQYSCKSYCTARTELNILASLKHVNIASIIGICPKPLVLVLKLAPQGSLDAHIKAYRRSGVRIVPSVLQKSFLQVSKALEYLHQHHIIYRDLKSENVLVWSFPNPLKVFPNSTAIYTSKQCFTYNDFEVDLKLADYGISRSSLPTGTKGFGGTEGFMAPEIMLFNGEEEYTEKVDCFSFAMFMYELCTLRFPFEGQEFAIRESILDGIRPALFRRDFQYLPESFVDLMARCWAHEPAERPTISQVVSIISSPEFCALQDVNILPDKYSIICAIGFEQNSSNERGKEPTEICISRESKKFGLFLSKIGKQLDYFESYSSKWNSTGYKFESVNLSNRTIISACIVNGCQLWLGDSRACVHVHDLSGNYESKVTEDLFKLICMIEIEFENPASLTAIKCISHVAKARLVLILSESGRLWLLSLDRLNAKLMSGIDMRVTLSSSILGMREIENNGQMIFTVCTVSLTEELYKSGNDDLIEVWCGLAEGKIAILRVHSLDLTPMSQTMVDHYDDCCLKSLMTASYIGSNVPLVERNEVFQLVSTPSDTFVWSVLYTGFIIYQWDSIKRQILHRLDCSKLAPCSESLMSISIEDHLKPGSCQITAISINEENDELYIGTNLGCIIVAELRSLKPITVFRPYQQEVKFILTLSSIINQIEDEDNVDTNAGEGIIEPQPSCRGDSILLKLNKPNAPLSTLRNNLWPFNSKGTSSKETGQKSPKNSSHDSSKIPSQLPSSLMAKKKLTKKIKPFVTIGKGYRNLLDRFTYTSGESRKSYTSLLCQMETKTTCTKTKELAKNLHAIIWDSGYWDFG